MMNFVREQKRKIIQVTTAVLYNINFLGFKEKNIYRGALKKFCAPGLNCYSCPGAVLSCPLGAFQNALMSKKNQNIFLNIPFYVLGLLILFGIIFGRLICGFLCPFGLIQEIIYKIKSIKLKKNKWTKRFSYLKYVILFVFVIMIPIILNNPGFCKYICPSGTLEAGIFHVAVNENIRKGIKFLFPLKLGILFVILFSSVFIYRIFCRFICPLGAFYGFFNKISFLGLSVDEEKCTGCNLCINKCLTDIKKVGDSECIECMECIKVCKANAIYKRYNKFFIS